MKIDRLISIIMILLERRRVSIPELAKLCEVSPRTISRDLETINQAGIPIVSYPGLHGGVGIMEHYKLEKRLFSTTDVTTLLMGLGCIRTSLPVRGGGGGRPYKGPWADPGRTAQGDRAEGGPPRH